MPRYDFSSVPSLDRVLVPAGADRDAKTRVIAAWSADTTHRTAEDIFQNVGKGETAYEATIEDLAQTQGATLARADAGSSSTSSIPPDSRAPTGSFRIGLAHSCSPHWESHSCTWLPT